MTDRQSEIDQNLDYFLSQLPKLLPQYRGKFAVLRHQKIVGYYDTISDAMSAGNSQYPDRIFSVQQVTDVSNDLGFYSHAMPVGNS